MNSANSSPLRWWAVGVFAIYSAINYLDRQTLAALVPRLNEEFRLSNQDYGYVQSAFSLAYALTAPLAGWLIDRIGLTRGAYLTIGVWSAATILTGFVDGFGGLIAARALLGIAQGGSIPCFSKASAIYLDSRERALGSGLNQLGLSAGSMLAPLLAAATAVQLGWRGAFIVAGSGGLLWIPLWAAISRKAPPNLTTSGVKPASAGDMVRDRRLWALIAGNVLCMTVYSLWSNWVTVFLVRSFGLDAPTANRLYGWIPPFFAIAGALFGGWLVMRWMNAGATVFQARSRAILVGGALLLSTAAVPHMPNPAWATAAISLSYFCSLISSANLYALPLDIFGPQRAATAVAAMTFGYGLMQTAYAPAVGWLVDHFGFGPACAITAILPLAGWAVVRTASR